MFINNFNKRERYLALATLSIVSIALVYVFIIDPIATRWKSLNSQIRSKVNMLEKDSRLAANQKAIRSEYAKLSKQGRPAKSKDQEVAQTLTFIEGVSKNDGCFIVNIKPVDIKNADSYKEILIDVTIEANMAQISKFLYDIENPRENLIDIKRFGVSSKYGQTGVLKSTFLISKALLD
ncbi:MAG: type 4a pilus biogenesis protein PilO [Candidatus Omnitrophica bacterium]|nr:type 4a pilus biogenesis protein PilO [Candidatus Omnitrophota bacterium]